MFEYSCNHMKPTYMCIYKYVTHLYLFSSTFWRCQ